VIDGDTIRYDGVKVRLADIDAPEIFSPKCASEAALGQRATQRLAELMSAGPFELVHSAGATRISTGASCASSSAVDGRSRIRSWPRALRGAGTAHVEAGAVDVAATLKKACVWWMASNGR
jgi:hypothetical protein